MSASADAVNESPSQFSLRMLRPHEVAAIDQALGEVSPYGEVHLVVESGRLRYIRTVRSEAVVGAVEARQKAAR